MKRKPINFALFQAGWFACVLLGTTGYHWVGPVVVLVIVTSHLATVTARGAETGLILAALGIGAVWENLLTVGHLVSYAEGQILGVLAPVWIVAMWGLLATTLNVSLRWLQGRVVLSALFGAIGGPMAFLAGERLGAVGFPNRSTAILALALGWAFLFPLLMQLARRLEQASRAGAGAQAQGSTG